jgi:hypothetical protein
MLRHLDIEGISIIGRISLPPLPVPAIVYAVLPGKFPARICRELNLRHDGFCAFARAKSGVLEAGGRKIPCIFPAEQGNAKSAVRF